MLGEPPVVKCAKCRTKKPCVKLLSRNVAGNGGPGEVWDYNECRHVEPKFLKSRDGKTRIPYDSSKHGYRRGAGI